MGWVKQRLDRATNDSGNWYCPDCFASVQYLGIMAHKHWHRRQREALAKIGLLEQQIIELMADLAALTKNAQRVEVQD